MSLTVEVLDLSDLKQAEIWLQLLDHYASDPMGGGDGLSDYAKLHLVETIRQVPGFHGALAWLDGEAVGLIDCFAGFSTFAARPLLNVHARAGQLGCCKQTLEVLSNNARAMASYVAFGFAPYVLDPQAGNALLMQKYLSED